MSFSHAEDLLIARPERGACRVVCFSPRHDLTLATMPVSDVRRVVDTWCDEYRELGALPCISHVQIFENRGAMMGASNPHPHGQIWATESVPSEPAAEQASLADWLKAGRGCMLCRYQDLESRLGSRCVLGNEHILAVVPFWAVWPFEVMVLPRRHVRHVLELRDEERDALADVLRRVAIRYDNLFQTPFPYSFGIHQAPTDGEAHDEWHLHMHFLPPLLRSATVRKFLVGFELLAQPQRDLTPETAAERLRALPETHWAAVGESRAPM